MTGHNLLLVLYILVGVIAAVSLLDWLITPEPSPRRVHDDLLCPLPWSAAAYESWMADDDEYPVPDGWSPLDVLTTRAEIEAL